MSFVLFETGIPNFVRGCILGWLSIVYYLWVAVTLISDFFYRICIECISPILFEVKFRIWLVNTSLDGGVSHTIFRSL